MDRETKTNNNRAIHSQAERKGNGERREIETEHESEIEGVSATVNVFPMPFCI